MTRNAFIATTAARFGAADAIIPNAVNISHAEELANLLEARGVAPWQPAPAQDDGEAVALLRRYADPNARYLSGELMRDAKALLARLDAAKGGAT